ncbi:MatE family protein [Histomonas meleagridis]|uniref:MatE family protein n=1 Tax=Histomonas meleagridis TaxID=135588 RepID=UPI00355A19A7|nr:MatE family protein [Histomonas meleagridis]KAH0802399.1 MatE family protein [Histomonas meleagridis]
MEEEEFTNTNEECQQEIIQDPVEDEHMRLGGYPPLKTIAKLLVGPLISQLLTSVDGLANSIWVSKFIGEIGLTAMSQAYIFENAIQAFGSFANTASNTKISYLLSRDNYSSAAQVIADIIRVLFLIGLIIPAIFIPLSKYIMSWLGAGADVLQMSFIYTIPLLSCTFTSELYYFCCGILQAEGRSWLYTIVQIISLVVSTCLFDPLFLSTIKHVYGGALSTALSEGLPGIVLFILVFVHKFSVKPTFRGFINKFDKATIGALGTGASSLGLNLSVTIPAIFIQKFVATAASNIGSYNTVMAIWNAYTRLFQVTMCVPNAINAAYLPSASYAFGKRKIKRVFQLTFHAVWIAAAWGALVTFVVSVFPRDVAKLWSTDNEFLDWSEKILTVCFYTIILASIKFIVISYLQVTQMVITAVVLSVVTELVPLPCFAALLHYTGKKDDPRRIFFAYICNDILAIVVCCIVALPQMIKLYRKRNDNDEENEMKEL